MLAREAFKMGIFLPCRMQHIRSKAPFKASLQTHSLNELAIIDSQNENEIGMDDS